jgi:hypothetical protein
MKNILLLAFFSVLHISTLFSQQVRSIKDITERADRKIDQIESRKDQFVDKVKIDMVFNANPTSSTEFYFIAGVKYHLFVLSDGTKIRDVNLKLYRCTTACDEPFERRNWDLVRQDNSTSFDASLDFSIPSTGSSGNYKIEVNGIFKPDSVYSHYSLIISRDNDCWDWDEKNTCSISGFFNESVDDLGLKLEAEGIEVVGLETGFVQKGSEITFPRKFYTGNKYHIFVIGDNRIEDMFLCLYKQVGTDLNFICKADKESEAPSDVSSYEKMMNFVSEGDGVTYRVGAFVKEFEEGYAEGRFAIFIVRTDIRRGVYPESGETDDLSSMQGLRLNFNQVTIKKTNKTTDNNEPIAKKGYLQICRNLTAIKYQFNDSKTEAKINYVYGRWYDKTNQNYHFFVRREGYATEKGMKFVISKDKKTIIVVDLDNDVNTHFWHNVDKNFYNSENIECSYEPPQMVGCMSSTSNDEECSEDPNFSDLKGARIELKQKFIYSDDANDVVDRIDLYNAYLSIDRDFGYITIATSNNDITRYKIIGKEYIEGDKGNCSDNYIFEVKNQRLTIETEKILINRNRNIIVYSRSDQDTRKYFYTSYKK